MKASTLSFSGGCIRRRRFADESADGLLIGDDPLESLGLVSHNLISKHLHPVYPGTTHIRLHLSVLNDNVTS